MKLENIPSKGEIVIFQTKDRRIQLEVKLEQETVWLTQKQIAKLFKTERSVITKHLYNIFSSKELEKTSVCAKIAHTAKDGKVYQTMFYNLDVIISVGYRVNSPSATQFRIWATSILKKYLVDGYILNEQKLRKQIQKFNDLQRAIQVIQKITDKKIVDYKEATGLLAVISDYNYALGLLDDYDHKKLAVLQTTKIEKFKLTYKNSIKAVRELKKNVKGSALFGNKKDESFKSSISAIYQTFDGKDLYPSVEEKAANLLYFIVKNHSFIDGNKRIAASIFLWFLKENNILYRGDGSKRIADNALVALTLMIAESEPNEKEIIVGLSVNLINQNN